MCRKLGIKRFWAQEKNDSYFLDMMYVEYEKFSSADQSLLDSFWPPESYFLHMMYVEFEKIFFSSDY